MDEFELSGETHQFSEWIKHYSQNTSTPIPWEDALAAQGKSDLLATIEKDEAAHTYLDSMFGKRP
jgi:hypothetical protein